MINPDEKIDVLIIGGGAAGLMCGRVAGLRGRSVLVVDHARKPAEKIRISGGGRCNFTNIHSSPMAFLSQNQHFCKSAFSRYTQDDFVQLITQHQIAFHEKKLGQLFCDDSAQQIIDMLLDECRMTSVKVRLDTRVTSISSRQPENSGYRVVTSGGVIDCASLVIATGGLSIPKIGATRFGYDVARQFNLAVTELKPALVPLTFGDAFGERCRALSGLSVDAEVRFGKTVFREGLLFTHRGLSGPSILQISSYWDIGGELTINLLPDLAAGQWLKDTKASSPKVEIVTALAAHLPRRLVVDILQELGITGRLADLSNSKLDQIASRLNNWQVRPSGTEGYRTAEVTLGGVDVSELSSKTMEAKGVPGLFFIGEVVDVTGHLGGYNFQWAWSSGFVAGEAA
ncbi:NAD(P)/FAD-dependent oxidoreductase [Alphaproteobacteria bacterium]|nr:NAD(P)/FAD-dependent oxidoreductase [Alphaproteobacteria bacterium]